MPWGVIGILALWLSLFGTDFSRASTEVPPQAGLQPASLEAPHFLGQTLLSRFRGLSGIEIYLFPSSVKDGRIAARLRPSAGSREVVRQAELSVSRITVSGYYTFVFPPLPDSAARDYYLELTLENGGSLDVGTAAGDGYFDGSLYRDGVPVDRQMVFRLRYDRGQQLLGLVGEGGGWVVLLGLAVWLFVIPGWAMLYLWPGHGGLSWPEKTGLAAGLSLALYALLFLWTDVLGVHLGAAYAWLPPLLGLLAIVIHNRSQRFGDLTKHLKDWLHSTRFAVDLMILALTGLVFLARFFVIRILDYPLWGDSYHHTLITQLFVDRGGLFNSWEPYAPLSTFTYHFGFHGAAAIFTWLSGLETPRAVLWTGQILNGAAVLALIPLAMKIWPSRWAALGPLLAAGLLAPMPMFYVQWGRYTQLAGQVILPGAVFFLWHFLETERLDRRGLFLACLALAGLALTHYRVTLFALLFAPAFCLIPFSWTNLQRSGKRLLVLALGSGLLFLPWLFHVFSGKIFAIFAGHMSVSAAQLSAFARQYNAIGPLTQFLPVLLWLLVALAAGWGLWLRHQAVALMVIWWSLVVLAANPDWLGLPGSGVLQNLTVFIALYIPAGILAGFFLGRVLETPKRRAVKNILTIFFCAGILAVGAWGTLDRIVHTQKHFNPLITRPDQKAAQWIRGHTAPQDVLLVNSAWAYDNSILVGMDGGWWLPLSAGRRTTLPPMLYSSEQSLQPGYREWVNGLITRIQAKGLAHPGILQELHQRGITHLYIGQRTGRVSLGSYSVNPTQILGHSVVKPVYKQDRIWIYKIP